MYALWVSRRLQVALPAPRGTIYDREGVPLAVSQEAFRINIAPGEVKDRVRLGKLLQKHAGLSRTAAQRALSPKKRWVVLPGRFNAATRQHLKGIRGVYFERVLRRFHPRGEIANELLGSVTSDNRALGGLELEFDALLRGQEGRALTRRDVHRQAIPGALLEVVEPVPGHDLHLTIDADLQEIAREALAAAIAETGSASGEIVMSDPRTGEVLAAVTSKAGVRSWRAVTEPYEPGSTLKPFAVATLLAEKRARLSDSVFAENGEYKHDGRTIKDVHAYGWLTVAEGLKHSSNVVLAKLSERLDSECAVRLPARIRFRQSHGSELSQRIERTAAPSRQLDEILGGQPGHRLRDLRDTTADADGVRGAGQWWRAHGTPAGTRGAHTRRPRDKEHGARGRAPRYPGARCPGVEHVLADVVARGTAQAAALGPFAVAGKTGTARMFTGGQYRSGAYTSSFAGFFPADDPQLVFLVKLDNPKGDYYGGLTAAPVTRATLEAALAALEYATRQTRGCYRCAASAGCSADRSARTAQSSERPVHFRARCRPALDRQRATQDSPTVDVPDVRGLPLRDAVRRLHASGFRVRVQGRGVITNSEPADWHLAAARRAGPAGCRPGALMTLPRALRPAAQRCRLAIVADRLKRCRSAAQRTRCRTCEMRGVTDDSRAVVQGDLFCAWRGTSSDSHDFCPRLRAPARPLQWSNAK